MSKKYYPETEANPNFADFERDVINYWKENKIFEESVVSRDAVKNDQNNEYVFYDGPPFANGLPHYGHLLTGFVKDLFARYQTIKGKKCDRKFGWDTHGLPVEMETEKELKVSGRTAIEELGIDKFNDACRDSVMKYSGEWQEYVERQARWVDFEGGYKTMDLNYMESVIWAFKQLFDKGLVYEDYRVMPYSWACQTPLSNFETRLDNSYRQKESKAVTVLFELENPEKFNIQRAVMMVWTTTPWTLPSNLALAVNNEIEYVQVEKEATSYIFAKNLIGKFQKDLGLEDIDEANLKTFKGSELIGQKYKALFSYLKDNKNYALENAFQILHGDFVNVDEGTGIVHLAPGFGEDDQAVCKANNIPTLCPVDEAGCFTDEIKEFAGMQVFDANIDIIKRLKETGNWLKTEQYLHNYPHCWRTDKPLIYKAVPSWYVRVTDFKDRMLKVNQEINWIPEHIKDGQFGKWLENARDWSISRNRFWGCPVPIWRSDDPNYPRIDVYGSLDELERDFGVRPDNLHRPYIDELTRPNPDDPTGKSTMRRVTDVLDCWFESGSMPYAQAHYPFENKEWFEEHFPADFIVEYLAQTRGWFYTLVVLSTALFDKPPFKNCICHGVILDENSQKLSKRLKNYTSPLEIFEKYGADSMRWFMCASTVMRGNELNIDKEGTVFKDTLRVSIKPIWNSYNFFTIYANADNLQANYSVASENILDRYILSKTKEVVQQVSDALDKYDTVTAYSAVHNFFEILNNWYIRRNRLRFWKSEKDGDKQDAYNTLYTVLITMVKAISPLVPLLSEKIYQGLGGESSVHLEDFPDVSEFPDEQQLVRQMDQIRDICTNAHSIRSKQNIRTRQPLRKLQIISEKLEDLSSFIDLIKDEVNVKAIEFISDVSEVAEYRLDLNFKKIGKQLGPKMKEVTIAAKSGNWERISETEVSVAGFNLKDDDYKISLIPKTDDVMLPLSLYDGLVALDINLDDELLKEGYARDIVRIIQQDRKDSNFDVSDRITINLSVSSENLSQAVNDHVDYIKEQTLAIELNIVETNDLPFKHEIENEQIFVKLDKVVS